MKTPFDLQKALNGHKLITRDGREVKNFHELTHLKNVYPYSAEITSNGNWIEMSFTEDGRFNCSFNEDDRDLFLEVNQIIPKDALKPIPEGTPNIPDGYVYMGEGGTFEYDDEKCAYSFRSFSKDWLNNIKYNGAFFSCCCNVGTYYLFPEDSKTVKINLELKQARELIGKTIKYRGFTYNVEEVQLVKDNTLTSSPCAKERNKNGYCVALKQGIWAVPFKDSVLVEEKIDNNETNDMSKSFEEKLAEAQKLIGKTVESIKSGGHFKVESVFVKIKGEIITSGDVDSWADQNGYCIAVNGGGKSIPYQNCVVVNDNIVINGYEADFTKVKSHGEVCFGCAKIKTWFFRELHNMLALKSDCKNIKGPFQIGAGTFQESDIIKIAAKIKEAE